MYIFIMKFPFLLLLFLNITFCENFIIDDVYLHFYFIKNIIENKSQVFERNDCTIT